MNESGQDRKQESTKVGITALRWKLTDIVDCVADTGVRFIVTALGRPLVAVVSLADLKRLEQLDRMEAEQPARVA